MSFIRPFNSAAFLKQYGSLYRPRYGSLKIIQNRIIPRKLLSILALKEFLKAFAGPLPILKLAAAQA
jgi:hypothetical protein